LASNPATITSCVLSAGSWLILARAYTYFNPEYPTEVEFYLGPNNNSITGAYCEVGFDNSQQAGGNEGSAYSIFWAQVLASQTTVYFGISSGANGTVYHQTNNLIGNCSGMTCTRYA
jgi:hypothetical protein